MAGSGQDDEAGSSAAAAARTRAAESATASVVAETETGTTAAGESAKASCRREAWRSGSVGASPVFAKAAARVDARMEGHVSAVHEAEAE